MYSLAVHIYVALLAFIAMHSVSGYCCWLRNVELS